MLVLETRVVRVICVAMKTQFVATAESARANPTTEASQTNAVIITINNNNYYYTTITNSSVIGIAFINVIIIVTSFTTLTLQCNTTEHLYRALTKASLARQRVMLV